MSYLVTNPENRFSCEEARMIIDVLNGLIHVIKNGIKQTFREECATKN